MPLKFHQRALDLLGISPSPSAQALRDLDAVESRRKIVLPPSVREWYEQERASDLLQEMGNGDPAIPIPEFGSVQRCTPADPPQQFLADSLLPFQVENQAVCMWAVRLDGSDDPPVVVALNERFEPWLDCSDHFSTYVYCRVWDHVVASEREYSFTTSTEPITRNTIEALSSAFEQEPQTHGWPGHTQHRFTRNDQAVLIWESDFQADWIVSAGDGSSLEQVLQELDRLRREIH